MQQPSNGSTFEGTGMSDSHPIDWEALASTLSAIRADEEGTVTEVGSRSHALAAIEQLVGAERIAASVDHYVAGRPGAELARSVLWLLRPWSAMQRCREIFDSGLEQRVRRSAVELLRVVADHRALPWVEDFLADSDPEIQLWGLLVVDQLLIANLVDRVSCEPVLALGRAHRNKRVRDLVARIEDQLLAPSEPRSSPLLQELFE